jgi:cytochrome c553
MRRLLAIAALSAASFSPPHASPAQDYMLYCMGCHGTEAQGVPGKVPPLAHSLGKYMRTPAGRSYVLRVPGAQSSVLSDGQLAAVLNWLAKTYSAEDLGADVPPFTTAEVTALRHTPLAAVLEARREVIRGLAAAGSAPPADY